MTPEDVAGFEGLIFDCDGTLVDTMPAHFVAWTAIAQKYGLSFPEARFYALAGVPATVILATLAEEARVVLDPEVVAREKEEQYFTSMTDVVAIEPVAAIARVYARRKRLAVATGSPRWSAERVLGQTGLLGLFDAMVAAEDVVRPKPAPDVFLEAALRIGVEPSRCCVFEDADAGLAGALAAGMTPIDIRPALARLRSP